MGRQKRMGGGYDQEPYNKPSRSERFDQLDLVGPWTPKGVPFNPETNRPAWGPGSRGGQAGKDIEWQYLKPVCVIARPRPTGPQPCVKHEVKDEFGDLDDRTKLLDMKSLIERKVLHPYPTRYQVQLTRRAKGEDQPCSSGSTSNVGDFLGDGDSFTLHRVLDTISGEDMPVLRPIKMTQQSYQAFLAERTKLRHDLRLKERKLEALRERVLELESRLSFGKAKIASLIRSVMEEQHTRNKCKQNFYCRFCKEPATSLCCLDTCYCSLEHQLKDWPTHQKSCKKL